MHCLEQGRVRAWTQLDHIVALTNDGEDTDENTQGLCDECHEAKTRKDLGQHEKQRIGVDGWPA